MAKEKIICYNCGLNEATTHDHVIPRTLIPTPRPANLPTVPACEPCNGGFSKDEEYLRDRLAGVVGDPNYLGPDLWDTAWRSLQDPKAHGKKIGFFKEIRQLPKPVLTKEGPTDLAVVISKDRTDRVIKKMVRALYYHRFEERMEGTNFEWMDIPTIHHPRRDLARTKIALDKALRAVNWTKDFGPYTRVACALANEDPRAGCWLFGLFGGHLIFALTLPSRLAERQP